jgi:exosome complex component RRP41
MVKRFDGRDYDQIRRMDAKVGVIPNANGSAMFKFGDTYAIAAVYGPRAIPKSIGNHDRAILRVRYNMVTFSVPERKKPSPSRREIELSEVIKRALEPALFLEEFPGTVIDVYVDILQADAGTRTAGINAASLALADAGILMKDLVVSVAVGKVGERVVIDLTKEEEDYDSEKIKENPELKEFYEFYGDGRATDIPVAMIPLTREFTSIQMDGEIDKKSLKEALSLALSKARDIRSVLEKAIIEKYKEVEL